MKLWVVAFIFFVSVGDANAGPYCGVYSLYGAAKSLGIDANLNDLCTAEYVTSKAGSSAQDLQRAGHALGIRVQPLTGLGRSILLSSQHPLILHVSPRGVHGVYNHWILFLGFENGAAIVHDGSGGSLHCTLEEILARWDGIALVINRLTEPSTTYVSWNAGWLFMLATIGFLITVLRSRLSAFTSVSSITM